NDLGLHSVRRGAAALRLPRRGGGLAGECRRPSAGGCHHGWRGLGPRAHALRSAPDGWGGTSGFRGRVCCLPLLRAVAAERGAGGPSEGLDV
ncbi:unnamed protein product, partial [Symbiodinium necroappetens]